MCFLGLYKKQTESEKHLYAPVYLTVLPECSGKIIFLQRHQTSSISNVKICVFRLKIYISSLRIYISSLKIKILLRHSKIYTAWNCSPECNAPKDKKAILTQKSSLRQRIIPQRREPLKLYYGEKKRLFVFNGYTISLFYIINDLSFF